MIDALSWLISSLRSCVSGFNFSISLGAYSFGLLDFLLITFLLGVVVRNFVHMAR